MYVQYVRMCIFLCTFIHVIYLSLSDVWKIYLEQEQYEMAKKYATGHREHMDTILVSQAEHYFKEQRLGSVMGSLRI